LNDPKTGENLKIALCWQDQTFASLIPA